MSGLRVLRRLAVGSGSVKSLAPMMVTLQAPVAETLAAVSKPGAEAAGAKPGAEAAVAGPSAEAAGARPGAEAAVAGPGAEAAVETILTAKSYTWTGSLNS